MSRINYSQSWEDPASLLAALAVVPGDRVLSVTSGGDNTLALCMAQPERLVAIDRNPVQNHVLSLKRAALMSLGTVGARAFLGARGSSDRLTLFNTVRNLLPADARAYWDGRARLIERGAIHAGKLERFFAAFRNLALPHVHSKEEIQEFLSLHSLPEQEALYRTMWDTPRWRFALAAFGGKALLARFARQDGMFAHQHEPITGVYEERFRRMFTQSPADENYFLRYCLTGGYGATLPPYLAGEAWSGTEPEIVASGLLEYLKKAPAASFTKFNLSDVFEALSPSENDALWDEIARTAARGARVAYWNNLVPRTYPLRLAPMVLDEKALAERLFAGDRTGLYGAFFVHTLHP